MVHRGAAIGGCSHGWRNMLHRGNPSASERRDRAQKVMYTVWNLWKERAMTESELQSLIELDVSQWRAAWSPPRRCFLSTLLFF
jgi:hypothetical protein